MTDLTIPPVPAADLAVGDRIAPGFLPEDGAATVDFVRLYTLHGQPRAFVAYRYDDGWGDSDNFLAAGDIPLESRADSGMDFTDLADRLNVEPAPVPEHVEGHPEGGRAVACSPECAAPTPPSVIRRHHVDCPVLAAAAEQADN